MFRRLIAAVDGSESAKKALEHAIGLARTLGATLDVVSIAEDLPPYRTHAGEAQAEYAEAARYFGQVHAEAERLATRAGLAITTRLRRGNEVRALLDDAREHGADLLVIGAQGHSGGWDAFPGSTAAKLVAHCPISLLVVHPSAIGRTFKSLVVGLDGSPGAEGALAEALDLVHAGGGTLRGISVVELPPGRGEARAHQLEYLGAVQARAQVRAAAVAVPLPTETRAGHAAETIVAYATETDADLIVAGATGRERPDSPTAGGTARRIASEAACSVLLVRPAPKN
jgi:nucleotide-binding universal stress UspA family protein